MNHFIIGLGGTGGRVIAAFRRKLMQEFASADPDSLDIQFLYVDSSGYDTGIATNTTMLAGGEQQWRTMGRSIQLAPAQVLLMEQSNIADILRNLDDYATIRSWIGDRDLWRAIMAGAPNGIEAAGQLRRFGRLLAAQNATALVNALTMQMNRPAAGGGQQTTDWTFHVVAGLAGGTGSGALIDVIGQIRKLNAGRDGKVVVYAVLPEQEETRWAEANYYANGYAALVELNAIIVGAARPVDIETAGRRYAAPLRIDNLFVMTSSNERALRVDVGTQLPALIADAMYQITVRSGNASSGADGPPKQEQGQEWRKMVTGENFTGTYESDYAQQGTREGGPVPKTPEGTRANRFTSFGVSRIVIPTQEIREYASAAFVRQFLLQSLNNAWLDEHGFVETQKPFDAAAEARSIPNRQAWALTDQHLTLQMPMLENDRAQWNLMTDEFRGALNGKCGAIVAGGTGSDGWVRELDQFARDFYDRQFRLVGVSEFYRVAERSIPDRGRHIVQNLVARKLFEEWTKGIWSLKDVARVVGELVLDVQERSAAFDRRIVETAARAQELEQQYRQRAGDYVKSGKWSPARLLRSRDALLGAIAQTSTGLYAARAEQVAFRFGQRLLGAVQTELLRLRGDIEELVRRFGVALEQVEQRRANRVQVDVPPDGALEHKLYDPRHVRDVIRRLETSEGTQREHIAAMRDKIVRQLGIQPSFSAMVERVNDARLVELLEKDAVEAAGVELDKFESERDRVLEASILQKLYEEYEGRDEALRKLIGEQVAKAASFAPIDLNQRIAYTVAPIKRCIGVFLPDAQYLREHLRPFHAKVERFIRDAASGTPVEVVATTGCDQEIVFLNLTNQFALRHLRGLPRLRDKYQALVDGPDGRRKRLELHIEGDGTNLPSLFARGLNELRAELEPYWLVARITGMVTERENPTTGEMETFFIDRSDNNAEKPVVVGRALADGPRTIDTRGAFLFRAHIESHLASLVHRSARAALIDQLVAHQNEVMRRFDHDQNRPEVVATVAAVTAARAGRAAACARRRLTRSDRPIRGEI